MLIGDIGLLGNSPHQIDGRDFSWDMVKSVPTAYFSNRNFAGRDTDGGAGIALWSDEPGAEGSGQLCLVAYGEDTAPRGNSFRLSTRGPGGDVERMCVDNRGRVGIGTQTPSRVLEVHGDVSVCSAQEPAGIVFYDEADGCAWRLQVTGGNVEIVPLES